MKVISLALFGSHTRYAAYLPSYVRACLTLFPAGDGWQLRVHHDEHLMENRGVFLRELERRGLLRLVDMGERGPLTRNMLWRLAPIWDGVDYVFCRDVDALPTPRDRACCDRFVASGCDVHTIADSSSHCNMMGGLCGFRAASFREITKFGSLDDLLRYGDEKGADWATHGTDQIVLNCVVYDDPRGRDLALFEHRWGGWGGGHPGEGDPALVRKASPRATVSEPTYPHGVMGDDLCAHLGAAGFDTEAARAFYEEHGDADLMRAICACEAVE